MNRRNFSLAIAAGATADLERFMAKCMGATTIEIDAGHLSLVSHVPEVSGLIMKAVAAF